MSDHAAFIRAIAEVPEDDAPRLVYADYLEERGEAERADFIRRQIREYRGKCLHYEGPCAPCIYTDCPRCVAILETRHKYLGLHGQHWVPSQFWLDSSNPCDWSWDDRGFVDTLEGPADRILKHLNYMLEWHPVRRVRFRTEPTVESYVTWRDRRTDYWLPHQPNNRLIVSDMERFRGIDLCREAIVSRLLKSNWPTVEFELPGHIRYVDALQRMMDMGVQLPQSEIRRYMQQELGLPVLLPQAIVHLPID